MGHATLDHGAPPRFTDRELARIDAMTPDDVERNARADAENPPLTAEELSRLQALTRAVQRDADLDPHPREEERGKAQRHAHRRRLAGTPR